MSQDLLPKVDRGEFQEVFIEDLNWLAPDVKQTVSVTDDEGHKISARNVASYKGLRVWVCDERPGSALEAELDGLIAKTTTDRLVIFDGEKEQVWRWPVRRAKDGSVTSRLTSHRHKKGDADPRFAARLDIIRMPFDVVLDANAVLGKVRDAFDTEAQNESKRASKLMANMYAAVEKAYLPKVDPKVRDHEISVTLARILFLMFGDDTEMWQTDAFRNVIQYETLPDGSNLAHVLNDLFEFLDTPSPGRTPSGFSGFKYVNGGIFDEKIDLPPLGKDFRSAILDACAVDWSGISPAIFGSMFQSVRDAETRRALGEHYTSEENILKTLNPLFLDELRDDLAAALARDTTKKRVNSLTRLWDRLGAIRFMDPACGCGNFIIVAYRELRAIELQVMEALHDAKQVVGQETLGGDLVRQIRVTLDHFYGIEIDEWPARIAETAMFMMDRQCDLRLLERFGQAPERLPIQREAKIVVANALRLDWSGVVTASGSLVIAGNPPFLGHKERSADQTADLKVAWGSNYAGYLDYVTGWYAKAIDHLGTQPGRFAFVSTNSVTQGQSVGDLFEPVEGAGWGIAFAHRTFEWTSEATRAAKVHCVIVGFQRQTRLRGRRLFSYPNPRSGPNESAPATINGYLIDGPSRYARKRSSPLSPTLPEVVSGSNPVEWGHLTLGETEVAQLRAQDKVAAGFIRPFMGGTDLINGTTRWCLWLETMSQADMASSRELKSRTEKVRADRSVSPDAPTRAAAATPHLFLARRQPTSAYLGIPQTFAQSRKYATAARLSSEVIASMKLYTAPDADGLMFGLISSAMFMTWQKMVGGRLKSDPSFSITLVWNNFPLPPLSSDLRNSIIEAGTAVEGVRQDHPGLTLARLYDPTNMPADLVEAHLHLDHLVDSAFEVSSPEPTELERQTALFRAYQALMAEELI